MRLINPQYHSSLPQDFEGKVYIEAYIDAKGGRTKVKVLHLTKDELDDFKASRVGTWKYWSRQAAEDRKANAFDTTAHIAEQCATDQHTPTGKEARQLMRAFNKDVPVGTMFTVRTGEEGKTKNMWTCSCAFMKSGRFALVFLSPSPDNRKESLCIPVHLLIGSVVDSSVLEEEGVSA